ncbi:MAG: hypothetical protein SAK29_41310 [Scytonema sp. PMC 1069.18]|nr:hypothetical protein [Scytonema sp. PMC 1069.18]MEC4881663.1 hypothetical protein [Scytonema sp. PMC 1070.18]
MQRQTQQMLSRPKHKSLWVLVGINILLAIIYHSAMVRMSKGNWRDYHTRFITENRQLKAPSVR